MNRVNSHIFRHCTIYSWFSRLYGYYAVDRQDQTGEDYTCGGGHRDCGGVAVGIALSGDGPTARRAQQNGDLG